MGMKGKESGGALGQPGETNSQPPAASRARRASRLSRGAVARAPNQVYPRLVLTALSHLGGFQLSPRSGLSKDRRRRERAPRVAAEVPSQLKSWRQRPGRIPMVTPPNSGSNARALARRWQSRIVLQWASRELAGVSRHLL